ncbi:hypothetical protein GCM10011351_17510 [Paraliobacillus quinghaiensis]|uniref:Uncharacterized protein n=1 Tax=Paraliobacillus quinghaiensis TaxID=470815 RepID=A0A917TQB3_9BACI|nr:hypothetical protein [Paraliobacillus quinghaiensis]GGM31805.1 hypothetical protein GCM10011351_17510 [Paraliobacillus quinghaiensis]
MIPGVNPEPFRNKTRDILKRKEIQKEIRGGSEGLWSEPFKRQIDRFVPEEGEVFYFSNNMMLGILLECMKEF